MSRWFCNGQPINEFAVSDRAVHYGDGLFETIAIRDRQPRLWQLHLERLEKGCERLHLIKPDRDTLRAWLDMGISAEQAQTATAKIIVSAGQSERGYGRSTPTEATVYVAMFSSSTVAGDYYHDGVDTIICDTRLAVSSVTAGCKTLNRIEQVLARSECVASGAFEGLTLDAEGRLICGTMSNVFVVSNDSIATPSLDRCGVEGVMRRHVMESLQQIGRAVSVRDIGEIELMQADEVFLSNSQFGLLPMRSCAKKTWHAHPVTRSVMALLAENGIEECLQ